MMQVVNEQARITTERVSNLVWKENWFFPVEEVKFVNDK
jgi:hypothetical protein